MTMLLSCGLHQVHIAVTRRRKFMDSDEEIKIGSFMDRYFICRPFGTLASPRAFFFVGRTLLFFCTSCLLLFLLLIFEMRTFTGLLAPYPRKLF